MKQRLDAARRDKRDERAGFILFFPINILLAFFITPLVGQRDPALGQFLPWLVNGSFVALTYIIRPHLSLGFLAGAFWLIAASAALGVIFVGSCVLSLVFLLIPGIGPILAILAWLAMLGYGLYRGGSTCSADSATGGLRQPRNTMNGGFSFGEPNQTSRRWWITIAETSKLAMMANCASGVRAATVSLPPV